MFVDSPASKSSFLVCIAMIIGSIMENISIDTIFNKNLPKETRGILNGAYSFMGQVGILIFSITSGWLFDHAGPKSPFYLTGVLDFTFAILIIVLSFYGLFDVYEAKEERS